MPPPVHMQVQINLAKTWVNDQLDKIVDILSSDGPFIFILSMPNVDLVEKLQMWNFASLKFIEFMAPRITSINFQPFHPDPNQSLLQNNINGITHNRQLLVTLRDNLYHHHVNVLYHFDHLEKLLADFIECLEVHISASL